MVNNLLIPNIPYAHKQIQEQCFIFPITGLVLSNNESIKIGEIVFVNKKYLENNILDKFLVLDPNYDKLFNNVKTFAIVDLSKYGDYKDLCKDGNNSLALQILKQTIGAIYISIYIKKKKVDCERRIVISNKGLHEVDEGLNSYMAFYKGEYYLCPNEVDKMLFCTSSDFELYNIKKFIRILNKNYEEKSQYEQKICKALEIIYSIYNESYSRERVIKWAILLNYLFREDDDQNLESTDIGRKLRIIFNVIEEKKILENIPKYICPSSKKTKKISDIMIKIYSSVRNNLMQGKIDFYTEYSVCNLEDMIILKVTVIELLIIMCDDKYIDNCKTIKDFNLFVEKKEAENIEKYKEFKKKKIR